MTDHHSTERASICTGQRARDAAVIGLLMALMWSSLSCAAPAPQQIVTASVGQRSQQIERGADGVTRFRLLGTTAPRLDIGGAALRLHEAVEAHTPDGVEVVVKIEIKVGSSTRMVELGHRQSVALPGGLLVFRYLLSGETSPGVSESVACFELRPVPKHEPPARVN